MVASDVIQLPLLFAGVPSPEEASAMIEHRAKGGKTIYFVTPEERPLAVFGAVRFGLPDSLVRRVDGRWPAVAAGLRDARAAAVGAAAERAVGRRGA